MTDIIPPGVIASMSTAPFNLDSIKSLIDGYGERTEVSSSAVLGTKKGWSFKDNTGVIAIISGNPYWQDRKLSNQAIHYDHAQVLASTYHEYGEKILEKLAGRFNLCVWDPNSKTGLIATDRFGQMPIYWIESNKTVFIAPTADIALNLSGIPSTLSHQGIYNYLFFHMVPSPGSIYEKVNKLPPAHALRINDEKISTYCYWLPKFEKKSFESRASMSSEMLELIESSVSQLSNNSDTGAFLSGGLDSSTVAGLLAQIHPGKAASFSIGFDAEGYDEIAYARIASKHFNTTPHEYYVTPDDVLEALPEVAAAYDEPFGNSSAIPAYFCARLAKENGISTLLAGDGGDELFAGNERYAKQTIFELYQKIPKSLRQHIIEPVTQHLPNSGIAAKLKSYVDQANTPLPDRLHSYNFLKRFPTQKMFSPEFSNSVDIDQPYALERTIYERIPNASHLQRMLYLDWNYTLADNDLRKVNRMCQLAGINVEYPLLDDLVVDFSTHLTPFQLMSFNRLRHFYKSSVKGFLPDKIINKSKHGFGLPFGVWMTNHAGLQKLANDNLMRMRDRGILNTAFIDELLLLHKQKHAGYYGELIWILVMLELWLTKHGF